MNNRECMDVLGQMLCYICDNQPNGANSIDAEALTHAIEHMKRGAPEGWQLVPKKPTVEMKIVGRTTHWKAVEIYKEMLSAAPEPPQERKD